MSEAMREWKEMRKEATKERRTGDEREWAVFGVK